ncbi:30S ribosomal protein S3 [Candidatus Bathyarchaeota archaeon]|nr:MAG: 30S ribosomal protein S3 [Candidatus Bathyarchaeota archaeon]
MWKSPCKRRLRRRRKPKMSVTKHFIEESVKKAQIDEFLQRVLDRAGYGGVDITKTPLGTHIVIYAMRPGLVIGRGGETIRELAKTLEEKFNLPNPQISVSEIEIPELNAHIVASRIAAALRRGVHYRRAGFWALNQIMEAGALGAEIVISGKLRTERARYEKFRAGYLPKSGDPPMRYMRKAEVHVQLKPGIYGVKVRIMPPDAKFPDKLEIAEALPEELAETAEAETGEAKKAEVEAEPITEQAKEEAEEKPPVEAEYKAEAEVKTLEGEKETGEASEETEKLVEAEAEKPEEKEETK